MAPPPCRVAGAAALLRVLQARPQTGTVVAAAKTACAAPAAAPPAALPPHREFVPAPPAEAPRPSELLLLLGVACTASWRAAGPCRAQAGRGHFGKLTEQRPQEPGCATRPCCDSPVHLARCESAPCSTAWALGRARSTSRSGLLTSCRAREQARRQQNSSVRSGWREQATAPPPPCGPEHALELLHVRGHM